MNDVSKVYIIGQDQIARPTQAVQRVGFVFAEMREHVQRERSQKVPRAHRPTLGVTLIEPEGRPFEMQRVLPLAFLALFSPNTGRPIPTSRLVEPVRFETPNGQHTRLQCDPIRESQLRVWLVGKNPCRYAVALLSYAPFARNNTELAAGARSDASS